MQAIPNARALWASAAATAVLAAAGCGSASRTTPAVPAAAQPAGPQAIRLTCDDGWIPKRRTFAARNWRRDSVRVGPLTLMGARRLVMAPAGVLEDLKIRTLVEPGVAATLSLSRGGPARSLTTIPARRPSRAIAFPACPPVPRAERARRDVAGRGFPLVLDLARPGCVGVAVRAAGVTRSRTLKVGVRGCRAD